MRLNAQTIINSRIGVGLALGLGHITPPWIGYPLATFIAGFISSRRNWPMVQAVRANQWIVSQKKLSDSQLDQVVRDNFRHTANCLYDLYHYLDNIPHLQDRIKFSSQIYQIFERCQKGKEGMVIVGVHMSNFDFVMQVAAAQGLRVLALSVPQPDAGYQWQNDLRRNNGLEIIPASIASIRLATKRLLSGGTVLTGIDRPQPNSKYHPRFFGYPAALPVMHIQMALKANVPVVVVSSIMQPDGVYEIVASDFIDMKPHPDHKTEILHNAEKVLRIAEDYICRSPYQWAMYYPVWPEVLSELPTSN